jgi:hypothetical protein
MRPPGLRRLLFSAVSGRTLGSVKTLAPRILARSAFGSGAPGAAAATLVLLS